MTIPTRLLRPEQPDGALPTLYAATMPDVRGGAYLGPTSASRPSARRRSSRAAARPRDEADARRLWDVSEQLTGVSYEWEHATTLT